MKRIRMVDRLVGAALVLLIPCFSWLSCSSESAPEDDEGKVCPDNLVSETLVIQNAVEAFRAYVDRQVNATTPACVALIDDLGGSAPPTSPTAPTVEELGAACQTARQLVVQEVMLHAGFTLSVGDATCATQASQDACELACGFGPTCGSLCPAVATFETVCDPPAVQVSAAQPFRATLETRLPAVAPLSVENPNIQAATGLLNMALINVLEGLDKEPLCAGERDAVAAAQMQLGPIQSQHATAAGHVANFLSALMQ